MNTQILPLSIRQHCRDYLAVTKPKVVALITFTAMVGMFLATPSMVPWEILIFGSLGIALSAASAAAINHLVDQRIDGMMTRTSRRPLPTGHLDTRQVLTFALVIGVLGMSLLIIFVNPLTALLTFCALIGYAVIYTMFLKRATPQNIVIGGAAGAAPPLLGWVAVTGQVEAPALVLFLIICAWTPPHFWALAIHRRQEYAKVDIPMLPVTHGVEFTRLHILLYTIILFLITLMPFLIGMSGWLYLSGAVFLGLRFLWYAARMFFCADDHLAMPTFGYSIVYLFGLFTVLMVDHYLDHYLFNILQSIYHWIA